jgi:hypothetical protein
VTIKVVVIKDDKPIDQITIETGFGMIGRRSDCDISIKDPAVSGNHACVKLTKDGYVIEDLGSTNGVHISGRQVTQHLLKSDDLVTIGEHQLKFQLFEPDPKKLRKIIGPKAKGQAPEEGYLKVKTGEKAGNRIELKEALTTVGIPGIQVAAVSKRPQGHFIIHVDGGEDKDKVPIVDGEPIGFKSRKLEPGNVIEVAGIQMEYCV